MRRSLSSDCRGVAALEFALVGPVFLVLLAFVGQASLLLWMKNAVQAVASQTARCTALSAPDCAGQANYEAFAQRQMVTWGVAGFIPPIEVSVQLGVTCNNAAGRFSSVTVRTADSSFSSFMPPLSSMIITATACFPSAAS